jgi:hypothetical protein
VTAGMAVECHEPTYALQQFGIGAGSLLCVLVSYQAGSRTVNSEPLPGSLATVTSPSRELAGDSEPKTRASELLRGRGIGLAELFEQLGLLLRCHADAGVGDGELDEVAAIAHLACRKLRGET